MISRPLVYVSARKSPLPQTSPTSVAVVAGFVDDVVISLVSCLFLRPVPCVARCHSLSWVVQQQGKSEPSF